MLHPSNACYNSSSENIERRYVCHKLAQGRPSQRFNEDETTFMETGWKLRMTVFTPEPHISMRIIIQQDEIVV